MAGPSKIRTPPEEEGKDTRQKRIEVTMEEKKRRATKGDISRHEEIEALVKEAGQNLRVWYQDPTPLLQRLQSFPLERQEDFFLSLLKEEGEDFLPLVKAIMGQEEKMDLAMAQALGRWNSARAADWLHQLASSVSSRAVIKAIRKSIFRLRSQGWPMKDIGDSAPSVYRPLPPSPAEGFLSSIDSAGTRMVWLSRPQPLQGVFAFHALISDLQGIIDFNGFETSGKKFHEYLKEYRVAVPYEIVEADPQYCHGLIIEAAAINQGKGQAAPEGFPKWRPLLGIPPELPLRPLIYSHFSEEELKTRSDLLDRSGSLFELSTFQAWLLEEEEMQKYLILLKEASQSRLVLTPYQKEGRVLEIYRQAVEELFDKSRRALFRRRLEEMAYILWKNGKQDEAQMTLAAALGIESEGGIFFLHPFLLEMVKRSLTARLEEEAQKKEKESDLLIKP